ncbi:MAG: class I SAM-dependent methyltransferase, partial [Adlercreutzia sp.]
MSIADEQRVSASGATTTQSASQPGAYSHQVIRKLNALTSDFYAREAASFSATRQAPWHGWEKAWELITAHDAVQGPFPSHAARVPDDSAGDSGAPLTILDLGCGNLRFERFLAEHTNAPLHITALDNCPDLASPAIGALSAAFPHSPSSSSAASKTKGGDASGQDA